MPIQDLKQFLKALQKEQNLLEEVKGASTAKEIAEIASRFGYHFSGAELKSMSKENIPGIKVKKQDTSPSYSFGESGN